MSATLRFLNEDADAEFLANPRIVTADNLQAKIEINRAQPVPQLNFNEQTATAVFGGFQDKKFGNTLIVTPSINKDNFVTLKVKPEISNKVGDSTFVFAGATVSSPIIDTRTLESNVLIRSGDTLAIGGLLQDEVAKAHNKVPLSRRRPGSWLSLSESSERPHQAQPFGVRHADDYRFQIRHRSGGPGQRITSCRRGIRRHQWLAQQRQGRCPARADRQPAGRLRIIRNQEHRRPRQWANDVQFKSSAKDRDF